jgi:hypothetical protein
MLIACMAGSEKCGITDHSTGPARKAAQAGEFKRYPCWDRFGLDSGQPETNRG